MPGIPIAQPHKPTTDQKAIAALPDLIAAARRVVRETTCVCIDDGPLKSECQCAYCATWDALRKAGAR